MNNGVAFPARHRHGTAYLVGALIVISTGRFYMLAAASAASVALKNTTESHLARGLLNCMQS